MADSPNTVGQKAGSWKGGDIQETDTYWRETLWGVSDLSTD